MSLKNLHFLERLQIDKGIEKEFIFPNCNMLNEILNIYIKFILIQEINNISVYAKTIKELHIKNPC